jgi:hypothetical protein
LRYFTKSTAKTLYRKKILDLGEVLHHICEKTFGNFLTEVNFCLFLTFFKAKTTSEKFCKKNSFVEEKMFAKKQTFNGVLYIYFQFIPYLQ